MKIGTLKKSKSLDGELIVINKEFSKAVRVTDIAANFREMIENWESNEPKLKKVYELLNENKIDKAFDLNTSDLNSCIPRTFLFADGSAFIQHVKLVRKARKAPLPETLETVPLMYQGECGRFLAPTEDIPQVDFTHGTDFEAEVGVVTDFVPMGVSSDEALKKIRFVLLINDVSLRGLIPEELAQGFGFFQGKPASALSPVCVTPDELGEAWQNGRVHLPLNVKYNGHFFGKANAKEMHFNFGQLIAHAAKTRDLPAGTIVGSGTVSNEDESVGSSCIAEVRMLEQIKNGEIRTPFMKSGDTVTIEMFDQNGKTIFGQIHQTVRLKSAETFGRALIHT
jgi:fumarylacetoacetate (FAA) hydrolase